MNNEILYQSDNYSMLKKENNLIFNYKNKLYYLDSYPYEPCLYIKQDNKIIVIIHNSFNTFEIEEVAKNNGQIKAITGNEYGIEELCKLLGYAIDIKVFDTDISYLEKKLNNDNSLKELIEDEFYKEYKKYDECVLDYSIIKNDYYNGLETHKKVVIFAMSKWALRYNIEFIVDKEKMKASRLDAKSFFETSKNNESNQYCYLFLNPPHGCNYKTNDFEYINSILFPKGRDNLEIFDWSTDWSNYFDDGLEWWGAMCVSIYDKNMNRFIVIGASATD